MDAYANRTIQGYELRERVGVGGFGAVYRAFQPIVGREVAIKIILPELANQADFIRRFEVEAQVIARLEHPHIVPLYDYWRDPDGAYLVMRWLPHNLRAALKRGPWLPSTTALLLDQISNALSIAHRDNIIHRDIKPDNILLDEDENAYLADFGIAKDISLRPASPFATVDGGFKGSPAYTSPEQITSQPLTARTDIYSLGFVIYEMLTGEKAFPDATTAGEYIQKHLTTPLPMLSPGRSNMPAAIDEVLQTATAKDPNHRYPNALRFAAAFRAALPNALPRMQGQPLADPLTERELDVLKLMMGGLSNEQISERLVLSPGTVKWYVKQIYSKLDVHSRQQAVERAHSLKLTVKPLSMILPLVDDKPTMLRQETVLPLIEPVNPYKGLRAFQEADADDFFGRAALVEQLLSRLSESGDSARFLAVVGPSGSGKSSVVKAGLISALRQGALKAASQPFIAEMLPGTHPLEELEAALLRVSVNPIPSLLEQLREDRRGLVRAAKRVLPNDPNTELVLVIDQFEELFTLVADEDIRVHFIDNLLSAATDPRGRIRVVLTLRADFYDRPLLYPRLAELVRSHTELVLPLSARELEQAISGPAERAGMRLEAGLVTTIVNEVGEQPGTLPLLQYALTELFEQREGLVLTVDAYKNSGGVLGALARRADELYNNLDENSQHLVRQLFLRLVTLGEGTEDTRRRTLQSELLMITLDASAVDDIIQLFSQYRLLTLDRDPVTRSPTVEVAHEALIRQWDRLREWLMDSREDIRLQRSLASAAVEWERASRDPSYLLGGTRLTQYEDWAKNTTLALTSDEKDYLSVSITERERQAAVEAKRRAREIRLEQRSRRFQHTLMAVFAVATVVALGLSGIAINKSQLAERNAAEAQNVALINGSQVALANHNTDQAIALALQAVTLDPNSARAEMALSDAAYVPGTVRLISDDHYHYDWAVSILSPDGRTLITMSVDNFEMVIWDLVAGHVVGIFPTVPNDLISPVAFRPTTGNQAWQLLTVSEDGTMTLWDYERQQPLSTFTAGSPVWAVVFSPDGERIAVGSDDGTVHIWDTDSGDLLQTLTDHVRPVFGLTFNADGTQLLSASDDGTVLLWDTATGLMLEQFDTGLSPSGIAFSPDTTRFLVSGYSPGTISLWDIKTHREVRTFRGVGLVYEPQFSPDGQTIFAVDSDGITFWDSNTGEVTFSLTGHTWAVTGMFPNADASQLLSVSRDGTIRQWDLHNGAEFAHTQSLFPYRLMDGDISPDGRTFAIGAGGSTIRPELPGLVLLYDTVTGAEIRRFGEGGVAHTTSTSSVRFSPDGQTMLSADWSGEIKLWDMTNGALLWAVQGITSRVNSVEFTPDGSAMIASTDEGEVLWINAATGAITKRIALGAPVKKAILTRDATRFLACLADESSSIVLVDIETGEILRRPTGQSSNCLALAVAPDDLTAVSGHLDGTILLWDLTSGQLMRRFAGGLGQITELLFSNDGQTIYSGSFPGAAQSLNVLLWDVTTGEPRRRYIGSPNPVDALDLSADGRTLLAGWYTGIARLWRIDDLPQLIDWSRANRYVPELTCDQRTLYRLEPMCKEASTLGTTGSG